MQKPKPVIIPAEWLGNSQLKRAIVHWTGGKYHPNKSDFKSYNVLIGGGGQLYPGKYSLKDNEAASDGKYSRHTNLLNSGSAGIGICSMLGAKRYTTTGEYPVTTDQVVSLILVLADLAEHNEWNRITRRRVLGHHEVEEVYNVKQKDVKWDVSWLPLGGLKNERGKPVALGGDHVMYAIRRAVREELLRRKDESGVIIPRGLNEHVYQIQRAALELGFDLPKHGSDKIWGDEHTGMLKQMVMAYEQRESA